MPNWCNNNISITGPNSVIDKIEKIVKEESNNAENGLLQFFHPMPKELLETEAGPIAKTKKEKQARQARKLEFGAENWYDWRVNNWGTKWDACEGSIDSEGKYELNFSFDTAWSPPTPWLQKVTEKYRLLKFTLEYTEEGMGFEGKTFARNGEMEDNCMQINYPDRFFD
mgnify:CR=1 FL=1